MNSRLILAVYACLALISGCATLNESECSAANWQKIGEKDGAGGERFKQLSRHQKACAKYGIAVDTDQYQFGRDEGLKTFCTAEIAYQTGVNGDEYFDVCPDDLASNFKKYYVKGLNNKLDQLSIEQERIDINLSAIRSDRAVIVSGISNKKLDTEINSLESQQQSILCKRINVQRWVSKWSAP